ncbi:type IV secretion system protein [Roseomonas sp. ACRSG]|nr:type IV secretion system protein [Roseomonas sp. ACRSG]
MAGDFFQNIALTFDANLISSINDVITSGLAWARPQVRAAATLFILISGWLVLTGRMDKSVLAGRVLRIMAVAALLTSAGTFNTYVRDLFLQDIPSTVGAALTGGTVYEPAAQFDALWSATQRIAATMLADATGYTQFGERLVIRLLMAVSFIALVVIFIMWIIARVLMGFVIALGPFLIGLALFDATRPFVDRWVGKLVSLTLVQLSVSVMLQMLMGGFNTYVRAAQANPGGSLDEKIGAFLQVAAWYWCGLILIKALAIVSYSIGGGLAASFSPQTQGIGQVISGVRQVMRSRSAKQSASRQESYQSRTATATEATAANTAPRS